MKPHPILFRNPKFIGRRPVRMLLRFSFLGSALLAVNVALADPAWYDGTNQKGVEPGTPDFYQHQTNNLSETEVNGGFCFASAFEDALYYLHNNGYGAAFTDNANWVTAMNSNLNSIVGVFNVNGYSANGMSTYIAARGLTASIGVTSVANPGGNTSAIFNTFTQDLLDGSNVLIHLVNNTGVSGLWWSNTYHVVDAVGFDKVNSAIVVADPDNNKYGGFGFPGDPNPNLLVNYDPNTQAIPLGNGFGDVGTITNAPLQEYTVDNTGKLTDGPYAGTTIDQLFVLGVVPEPSSIALVLASAVMFGGYRLAGRQKTGQRTS
jgi:hypothetical protein